jgi:DUF4097 and DUF4098 domain-containing protein YvlB
MNYCRECGAELPQDARFCPKCGARVATTPETKQQEHRVFKLSARPKLVVINHAPGNVDVKTAADGEVVIDLDLREPEDIDWRISQEGNNVNVTCRTKVHFMNWARYFGSGGPRSDITISLPVEADLDVDAHLDQVTVKGLKGSINVNCSVAKVDVEGCEGTIRVSGKTGYIDLRDVGGTIDVDSTTGPVDLQNANGTITVRNTTGPIRFGGSLSTGENRLRTTTGSIEVLLQGKLDLTVEAHSRLGRVTCSPELTNARNDRGYCTGQIGNGSGRLIVETETGSITIRH